QRYDRVHRCGLPGLGFSFGCGFGFGGCTGPGAPPLPPRPSAVGAGSFGGASGTCIGSKQADMSSAVSSRGLMDGTPNNSWQNFTRLMWECCVCETYPFRAYGLMTRQGTREP